MTKTKSKLFVLAAGILWGTIGIFVRKFNANHLNSMDVVAIRVSVTAIVMFLGLLLFKKELLKIRVKDIWCFLGTGILSIVFFNFCYFHAVEEISLSVAAVLLYTAPAFVMIMSGIFFKEKISVKKIYCIIATVVGCALSSGLVVNLGQVNAKGILYGIGSGIGYALYSIFSRYAIEKGYKNVTITFYTFLIAAIVAIPLSHTRAIINICFGDWNMLAYSIVFGLLSTILPFLLYTMGLEQLENSQASIIASIEPITATIIGWIKYGEVLDVFQIMGIALVIGAVLFQNVAANKK